ncbi:MAG TPA: YidC/Oxa1 family membrane protein insertase [Steroidobacter sp.]|uniref:YidC/Oxa1 family membrane protein insertase n=1 Tax=Steroidobacter sp. TaxID=1978227 RepID=UPI002EDB7EEC
MLEVLDQIFLQPLMLIYSYAWFSDQAGPQLVIFSVLLNVALLPLYYQMEQRSKAARAIRQRVASEVARMKRHFRGRERYFYIRTVYRHYRYHPISEVLGSADLFVQIVVFVTVYRFLSGLEVLVGAPFGPIADLSRPDGLLGGVNVLPLLMTAINAASVYYYVEDRGKRLQAWLLATLFLVLLYQSAAALTLYWTLNNLFSLVRNVVQRKLAGRSLQSLLPFERLAAQR